MGLAAAHAMPRHPTHRGIPQNTGSRGKRFVQQYPQLRSPALPAARADGRRDGRGRRGACGFRMV